MKRLTTPFASLVLILTRNKETQTEMVVIMKIGNYQIGRYHGIIKKMYEDGSFDYETSFSDAADLMQSVYAIHNYIGKIGKMVGIATDNPRVLVDMTVIRGKENIIKELTK